MLYAVIIQKKDVSMKCIYCFCSVYCIMQIYPDLAVNQFVLSEDNEREQLCLVLKTILMEQKIALKYGKWYREDKVVIKYGYRKLMWSSNMVSETLISGGHIC